MNRCQTTSETIASPPSSRGAILRVQAPPAGHAGGGALRSPRGGAAAFAHSLQLAACAQGDTEALGFGHALPGTHACLSFAHAATAAAELGERYAHPLPTAGAGVFYAVDPGALQGPGALGGCSAPGGAGDARCLPASLGGPHRFGAHRPMGKLGAGAGAVSIEELSTFCADLSSSDLTNLLDELDDMF
ncbi:hypothetical protein T492DRAFT_838278 [Pavlovales sp. CCMP2436]|nr:hypothetical protein T492DRAFT_838278 [Pavlovales sp. CCMP2436]